MADKLNPFKVGCPECGSLEFTITESKIFKEVTIACSKPVLVQSCNGCGRITKTQVNHDHCQTDDIVKIYEKLCNMENEFEVVSIPQKRRNKKAL